MDLREKTAIAPLQKGAARLDEEQTVILAHASLYFPPCHGRHATIGIDPFLVPQQGRFYVCRSSHPIVASGSATDVTR